MKKLVINIFLIITMLIVYFMQLNFFNWFTIASVMPNIFVIYILFIGLFTKRYVVTMYASILGILIGSMISTNIVVSVIGYLIVAFISIAFDKNFSKASRVTIMVMVAIATAIYEVYICTINYFIFASAYDILKIAKMIGIEVGYNVLIATIIYPFFSKIGPWIENEYKGNKILTRYF